MMIHDRRASVWFSPRVVLAFVFIQSCTNSIARAQSGDDTEAPSEESTSEAFLKEMRQHATGLRVSTIPDTESAHELVSAPVFRYSDQRRNMLDGTLWRWGTTGRPVALMKVELYPTAAGGTRWVYCLASLSDDLIEAGLTGLQPFRTTEPGLTVQPIPDVQEPAGSAPLRRLQMKRLAQQFNVTIWNDVDNSDQMRLLPTPICRYSDPEAQLLDGAVFGFTMGTNPDVLVVIEADSSDGAAEWRFGCVCMTSAGFKVRSKDRVVFEVPFSRQRAGAPAEYERWMWRRGVSGE